MTWCILLTGMPNSGKSTIAYELVQKKLRNTLVIDGDKHREMQFLGDEMGFGKEDIMKNNKHVIKLARFAQEQGFNVIIAQIAPYKDQRENMRNSLDNFIEIHLDCPEEERERRPNYVKSELKYEYGKTDFWLYTESMSIDQCVQYILDWMHGHGYI